MKRCLILLCFMIFLLIGMSSLSYAEYNAYGFFGPHWANGANDNDDNFFGFGEFFENFDQFTTVDGEYDASGFFGPHWANGANDNDDNFFGFGEFFENFGLSTMPYSDLISSFGTPDTDGNIIQLMRTKEESGENYYHLERDYLFFSKNPELPVRFKKKRILTFPDTFYDHYDQLNHRDEPLPGDLDDRAFKLNSILSYRDSTVASGNIINFSKDMGYKSTIPAYQMPEPWYNIP